MKTRIPTFLLVALLGVHLTLQAHAQGAFTYQGLLADKGAPANGNYDLRFTLYDAPSLGNMVGMFSTFNDLNVSNGLFTVILNPGSSVFDGNARWLEIGVRPGASSGDYTNVGPRQPITASPYAVHALKATMLDGPLPANQLTGTYPNAVNLNNPDNQFAGNGAGLTSLNASQLATGVVPDTRLSPNVALLDANQVFTGTPSFSASVGIGTATPLHRLTVGVPETPVNIPSLAGFYRAGGAYLTARDTTSHVEALLGADTTAILAAMTDHPLTFRAGNGAGFGNTEYMRIERGGNVGIGTATPFSKLHVNGTTTLGGQATINGTARVTGVLRVGSETGTSQAPNPAGVVIRRINSTSAAVGQIVARTDVLTLERNGTYDQFVLRVPANVGNQTLNYKYILSNGQFFGNYILVLNYVNGSSWTIPSASGAVHLEITFGNTFEIGGHLTQVSISRFGGDPFWSGFLISTYNQ